MICRLSAIFLLIMLTHPVLAPAQSVAEDSVLYHAAFTHTREMYDQRVGDQSLLYNGRFYGGYGFSFTAGTPYFLSDDFRQESLVYDGIPFDHIPLLYDNLLDQLITRDEGLRLQLAGERIKSFTIGDHHFVRLVADSLQNNLSGTGFYELLYQGRSTVFKKTVKQIQEELSPSEGILRSINQTDRYYIRMGIAWFPVRSKREMLNIFSDHKKEIHQFIRKNKLKYRKNKENMLIRVTAYYDQLK